ncbi:DUF4268 domain-containing protein [Aquirufa aurantiipilula]|uniref:DUF4268 domain-containing protein n=1 Tax=Aquirufa aurantiipilula TaxID=2696561 RepID=UPI001CAA4789|nr:DUF4268 domain-containing protein [Aquirufa aurantiipilula]MBZ1326542.1 DUF4268 domain-containing protein [Aquirufa aurantiipilula]
MTIKLARITKVNPREVWKHEALDFTQWLAKDENIAVLCEELELNLENIKPEAAAGRYNVDLVADDIDTKRKVIIENQLEPTDHKHLGQILTYASSYDASVIIWVVTDYTEEHRQAIDWFNRNISENISFFLVQIEVYKIGESDPAPKFNIICEPNNWGKTLKSSGSGDTVSATKLLQMEFWEGLKEYATARGSKVNFSHSPKPKNWFNVSIGSSKCHVTLTLNTQKPHIGCELFIMNDKALYSSLFQSKAEIEKAIGLELEWRESPDNKSSVIQVTLKGNPKDRQHWNNYFEWCTNTVEVFSKTFKRYISN